MAISIMNNVWKFSSLKGAEKLLLIAIADNANDIGYAWPGMNTLAKKVNMSERHTRRMVYSIQYETGELLIESRRGRNNTNGYWVIVGFEKDLLFEIVDGIIERNPEIKPDILTYFSKLKPDLKPDILAYYNSLKSDILALKPDILALKPDIAMTPELLTINQLTEINKDINKEIVKQWEYMKNQLANEMKINSRAYQTKLQPAKLIDYQQGRFIVACPDPDWNEARLSATADKLALGLQGNPAAGIDWIKEGVAA